jgi:uncharacterized membrane protein
MDDKTLQALTALATKLGTTAEYLWGVLLKQAPITGLVHLALLTSLVVMAVWWTRVVIDKTTEREVNGFSYPRAEWQDEEALAGWLSVAAFAFLAFLFVITNLADTVAALLNPEYWALKQILK